jgi:hypothetical protein
VSPESNPQIGTATRPSETFWEVPGNLLPIGKGKAPIVECSNIRQISASTARIFCKLLRKLIYFDPTRRNIEREKYRGPRFKSYK